MKPSCLALGIAEAEKSVVVDGDPAKLQEIFHIMAEARRKIEIARSRKKDVMQLNKDLRKIQALLKEKKYEEAKELALKTEKTSSELV